MNLCVYTVSALRLKDIFIHLLYFTNVQLAVAEQETEREEERERERERTNGIFP